MRLTPKDGNEVRSRFASFGARAVPMTQWLRQRFFVPLTSGGLISVWCRHASDTQRWKRSQVTIRFVWCACCADDAVASSEIFCALDERGPHKCLVQTCV